MNTREQHRTDRLKLSFRAHGYPLAKSDFDITPFLVALDTYAAEWMPDLVKGKRRRKYSHGAVLKALEEQQTALGSSVFLWRSTPPESELSVDIWGGASPGPLSVSFQVWPLSLFEEPANASDRSRRLIELARAWASHYPVIELLIHGQADSELSQYWRARSDTNFPARAPYDWLQAIFWLNVFGKEWVDGLGRARVLSTPAHLVEELPNGAVLLVTRPTIADWASEEARQAQARALVHLKPGLDFDSVLRELRERSAALAPVEPRFEPDLAPLLQRIADWHSAAERPRQISELNAYRPPEVSEWLPAKSAPPSDVTDPKAAIERYEDLAEELVILVHDEVPSVFQQTPESLTDVDFHLWTQRFPDSFPRERIEAQAVPAVGAYLGEVLVRHLGGRWVPRRNLDEAQVIVGDRAWLPFARARRYMQSTQALIDYSLTKLYRDAEKHRQ